MAWSGTTVAWRIAASSVAVALSFAACAKGSSGGDDNAATNAQGPGPTSGPGGAGGSGGSTTVGSGGSGGVIPPCDEMPCKLTSPQCGCSAGEKCTLAGATTRICTADGSAGVGEGCTQTPDSCAAGSMCLSLGGVPYCFKFCNDDMECGGGPGAKCIHEITGGAGDLFCSINCDPISGQGCLAPNAKCHATGIGTPLTFVTMCTGAGTGTQGSPCPNGTEDCAAGFNCFGVTDQTTMMTTDQCLQWCDANSGTTICPPATTCYALPTNPIIIGPINYGACL